MDANREIYELARGCRREEVASFTNRELAAACDGMGVGVTGTKYQLVERIMAGYCAEAPIDSLRSRGRLPDRLELPGYSPLAEKLARAQTLTVQVIWSVATRVGETLRTSITVFQPRDDIRDAYAHWVDRDSGVLSLWISPPNNGKVEIVRGDRNGKTYYVTFYNLPRM
jgi:hypothetical protein